MRSPAGRGASAACRRTSCSVSGWRRKPSSSSSRTARSRRSGSVSKTRVGDRADRALGDVALPTEGIDELSSLQRTGHRIEREVPAREVFFDPARQGREVDSPPVLERDPPGAVPLGEGKRRSPAGAREDAGRTLGLAARDVEVDHRPPEQLVAQRTAHEPALRSGQRIGQLGDEVSHRRAPAACAPASDECPWSARS